MPVQTSHKIIIGVTAFLLILGVGFVYSQGSSFQGAFSLRVDRDRDGMRDAWENTYGLNPAVNDAASDLDGDGLTNLQEFTLRTYPNDTDSDDDGLSDGDEVNTYGTLPLDSDSDDGTISDGDEVTNGTNPLDGSDDVAVSLPDLVGDEASTTFSISGEVFVDSSGEVVGYDITENTACGIRNDGYATASGPSYYSCHIYNGSVLFATTSSLSEDIDLAPGEILVFNEANDITTITEDLEHPVYLNSTLVTILDALYADGSLSMTVQYYIDTAVNSRVITESDETNNQPSYTITVVDNSLITWTIQE